MEEPEDDTNGSATRLGIIQAVRTPLGFFTLAVLVVEVILGIVANRSEGPDRTYLVIGMLVLMFLLVLIVAGLAVFRPEALSGSRPMGTSIASADSKITPSVSAGPPMETSSTAIENIDPKLIRFVPPFRPAQFKIVDLPRNTGAYYDWQYSPTGLVIVYAIPFFLLPVHDSQGYPRGHLVLSLQPTSENAAKSEHVEIRAKNVSFAHFLLAAGNGWRERDGIQFLYRRIGSIHLQFDDGQAQSIDLILGKNIREWAFGNSIDLVTEIDTAQAKPAWLSHDNTRRIDMMSVPIAGAPKALRAIQVVAQFEHDHPGKYVYTPAVIISAITLERSE